jgi:aspartyl-tRNA(Asn)/glutamyl-tRNA(Gln) amidotransferase subunit C
MIKREDIDHLATLARIALSEQEKVEFPAQLEAILAYVGEVSSVVTASDATPRAEALRSVMRPDTHPREGGTFTAPILENAPHKEDGYVKVQQIF